MAGTEIGVKEPQATFSACFGEPFMPMHPGVYADLLSSKMSNTMQKLGSSILDGVAGHTASEIE